MGMIKHKCLIVSVCINNEKETLLKFLDNSKIYYIVSKELTNGYSTIIIPSSGSKVGWEEYNKHLVDITKVISYIESLNYEVGSNSFDYIELEYGEFGSKINNSNCENLY